MSKLRSLKIAIGICALVASFVPQSAWSCEGGTCGGGSDVSSSSPIDVENTIDNIFTGGGLESLVYYFQALKQSPEVVDDPDLKALFEKMVAIVPGQNGGQASIAVVDDLFNTKSVLNRSGPCPSAVGPQDASVSANELHASVCYSIPQLSRIPKSQLKVTLLALTAGELSHHYGADEALAKKVQNFFLKWIPRVHKIDSIHAMNADDIQRTQSLISELKAGSARPTQVCAELGNLHGLETNTMSAIFALLEPTTIDPTDPEYLAFASATIPFSDPNIRFAKMLGYCGIGPSSVDIADYAPLPDAVAEGDSKALIDALETDSTDMEKVGTALQTFSVGSVGAQ